MKDERGVTFGPVVGIVVVVLALVGLFAICSGDDGDIDTWAPVQVASHEYDDGREDWSNEDRNRNRNRNRGAFSPGPFDDSPVDAFNGNVVCLPGSTCYADRGDQEPPPDERR